MNKKLLASAIGVALAGAMATGAANADVKIYGKIHSSYDFYSSSNTSYACDTGTCTDSSGSALSNNAWRIGFKGSEDIGGGNAFIWQVENSLNPNGSSGSWAGRNTFAGFRGGWGTFLAGRHDSPIKMADTHVMPWNDTVGDSRNLLGSSSSGGSNLINQRFSRVLAYMTPSFNGFTGMAVWVGNNNASNPSNTKAGGWDLAGNYKNGPINAWLAYEKQFSDVSNSDLKAWRLSGSYDFAPFKVGGIYEDLSADSGYGLRADRSAWGLFGKMGMGMNSFGLAYYKANSSSVTGGNDGADQWVINATHKFSKTTNVYAQYAKLSNDNNASFHLGNGGHGENIPGANAGDSPSAFSVGFIHHF
ncbi:MAG TPA: porin [Gammaproteobacteria bacterium]|nr:porin [Gammaproteobacteria bacterium]